MVFTVSPTEAQAMQEDQAQLLGAISQATRGIMSALEPSRSQSADQPQTMRIQMGRRLVYGQMARGEFRNELTPDRLKTVFDALQRPASEDVDLKKYKGKIPAIEIKDGDTVLFREESDGVVTVNQIAFQIQQHQTEGKDLANKIINAEEQIQSSATKSLQSQSNLTEYQQQLQKAQQLRVLAQSVLDLQGVTTPTGNRQYQSKNLTIIENADNETLSVTSQEKTVLQATREGQILVVAPNDVPTALSEISDAYKRAEKLQWQMETNEPLPEDLSLDWQAQNIQAQDIANIGQFLLNPLGDEKLLYNTVAIADYTITQDTDGLTIMRGNDELVLIVREGQVWDYSSTGKDWETLQRFQPQRSNLIEEMQTDRVDLTADFTPISAEGENTLPAIAIAQREATKLPDGATKQLLQATHQDWKQQVFQGLGQGLRETMSWLASRPEIMRDQGIARSSLELFHRGYLRTSEKSYEMGNFTVSLQGADRYVVSDATGELMRFKATKSSMPGIQHHNIQILSKSDRLTSAHQATFQQMRQDKALTPVGELDVEARYGAKTQQVEQTVRAFLKSQNARVWDKEKGRFKFEIGEDNFLRITDKRDGRGVVYRRDSGRVMAKLQPNDFAHFDRLAAQMQTTEHQQDALQEKTRSNQKQSSGMELS